MLIKIIKSFFLISTSTFSMLLSQNINDIKRQYEELLKNQQSQTGFSEENIESISSENPIKVFSEPSINTDKKDSTTFYFGYDFFTKRDTIDFWNNLPAPKDYVLGPGDEIILSLWGETQLRKQYTISKSGSIYDNKVGLINVSGKNLNDLSKYLKIKFGEIYSTLTSKAPSTFIDV